MGIGVEAVWRDGQLWPLASGIENRGFFIMLLQIVVTSESVTV
jgi:hypothetical protein